MMKTVSRFLWTLVAALPLAASSVLPVDFQQLSQTAQRVVGGEIIAIEAEQNDSGYLFSSVTIRVTQSEPQDLVGQDYTFKMIGGELNGRRQYISDFPKFQTGDTVVLFLTGETSSVFGPTVGLWQGVFFVEKNAVTDHQHQPIVGIRGRELIRSVRSPSGAAGASLATGSSAPLGMAEFFEKVRENRAQ